MDLVEWVIGDDSWLRWRWKLVQVFAAFHAQIFLPLAWNWRNQFSFQKRGSHKYRIVIIDLLLVHQRVICCTVWFKYFVKLFHWCSLFFWYYWIYLEKVEKVLLSFSRNKTLFWLLKQFCKRLQIPINRIYL